LDVSKLILETKYKKIDDSHYKICFPLDFLEKKKPARTMGLEWAPPTTTTTTPNSYGGNCKLVGKRQLFMGWVATKKGKLSLLTSFCEDTIPNSNAFALMHKRFL
jgi:hypothetical protein